MEELAKKIANDLRKELSQRAKKLYEKDLKAYPIWVRTFRDLTDGQVVHLSRIIELILKGKNTLVYDFDKPSEEKDYLDTYPTMNYLAGHSFYYEDGDDILLFAIAGKTITYTGEKSEFYLNTIFTNIIFKIKDKLSKDTK